MTAEPRRRAYLEALGFDVDYSAEPLPHLGILDTELFYCRLREGTAR